MSIVAISETAGSLGNEMGRRLAESLGYAFADREIIAKTAERFHEDPADLRHGTEEKPSLWERLTGTQQRYQTFVEATILDMAAQGNVVLAGLASAIVLRDVAHAVRVRTNAPALERARRVEQQHGLVPEAAVDFVHQADRERAARVKFLYHVDVDDPLLYDLVLNTERMTVEQGVRIIAEILRDPRFQPSQASRTTLTDRHIVAQARAAFLAHPALGGEELVVSSVAGRVSLAGQVHRTEGRDTAEAIVRGIPGVVGLSNEVVVTPPTGRMMRPR
jgi:cytidylate kinase